MEVKLVKAYLCPICKKTYTVKRKGNSCFKRCTKEKAKNDALELRRLKRKELMDYVRNSASSFEEVPELLEGLASEYGYKLSVSIRGKIKLISTVHSNPIGCSKYRISSNYEDIKEHNKIYNKNLAFTGRIEGRFERKKGAYNPIEGSRTDIISFSSWLGAFNRGINLGTGGGCNSFHFELTMYVEDFPKILESYADVTPLTEGYAEFLRLSLERKAYMEEKNRLTKEYQEEYFKWKKFSDVTWSAYESEKKEIIDEMDILKERLVETLKILSERAKFLDDEREKMTKPDIDFDRDRFKRLASIFG